MPSRWGFLYRSRHGCRQLPQNAMFILAGAEAQVGHGCVQLNLLTKIPQFAHSAANIQTIVSTCFVSWSNHRCP
jgi:hypothetical protein